MALVDIGVNVISDEKFAKKKSALQRRSERGLK